MTRRQWLRSFARAAAGAGVLLAVSGLVLAWVVCGPLVGHGTARPIDAPVSVERLKETVDAFAVRFRTRWLTHPETLEAAAGWIAERMRESDLAVSYQTYELREGAFHNVVGVREGTDPEAPVLVVGAHYDAYGEFPGADDNASGVAALLELARTFPAAGGRSVRFVAFVNEEPPFFGGDEMGSARYARSLVDAGIPVHLMLSLEMLGCWSDEPGSQRYPLAAFRLIYPSRGNFLAVVGDLGSSSAISEVKRALVATRAIPVRSFRGPRWIPGVDWSDHSPFRMLGMRAVMITDTAFLRNPRYHSRRDTPDTLDYERLAAAVRAIHGVLRDTGS